MSDEHRQAIERLRARLEDQAKRLDQQDRRIDTLIAALTHDPGTSIDYDLVDEQARGPTL